MPVSVANSSFQKVYISSAQSVKLLLNIETSKQKFHEVFCLFLSSCGVLRQISTQLNFLSGQKLYSVAREKSS